ncbi:PLP-dependent aminotransferase family protein [Aquabacterium sp.]|uniref:aminotransferase-like domain-containing protein n=1 Tax=Aquabacterium sp. TaxID=1872578 RepID=UPI0037833474
MAEPMAMKQVASVFIQSLQGEPGMSLAQRVRVYRTVLEGVRSGTLRPGTRLPSARRLAADCAVSRGAVDEAFEQLQSEGLIERRVGDGSYVANPLPAGAVPAQVPAAERPASASAQRVIERFAPHLGQWSRLEVATELFALPTLHPRNVPTQDFPLDTWRRLMNRAWSEPYRSHLNYGPSAGLPQLREAIRRHLALTRGVHCEAGQILIVNSPMQAVELIARVLLEPGDKVWLEDPGHASLPVLFEVLKARAIGVPFDGQGLDVAHGRRLAQDARLVYLHPLGQHPLGIRTTAARGAELLRWATEQGSWIIEGNYNTEIVHEGVPPPALYTQDHGERVLLVGTFEGVLFPSLRLAYVVVPQQLVTTFTAMRGLLGEHAHVATQLALTAFIEEGHMSAHLRELRQRCRARREALLAAARAWLPGWARLGPTAEGMHAAIHLPAFAPDIEVFRALRKLGIGAVPLSSICWHERSVNGLALGYGGTDEATITETVGVIGQVLRRFEPGAAMS